MNTGRANIDSKSLSNLDVHPFRYRCGTEIFKNIRKFEFDFLKI